MKMTAAASRRFHERFEKSETCWEWKGTRNRHGYGVHWTGYSQRLAHRISYRIYRGRIPKGKFVCHRCDNPICVSPFHLFLGSASDNMQDALRKGRLPRKHDRFSSHYRTPSDPNRKFEVYF